MPSKENNVDYDYIKERNNIVSEIAEKLLVLGVDIAIISEATGVHPSTLVMLKDAFEREKRGNS
jgi:hypothetical protein